MNEQLYIFASAFAVSALAGLASLLRSDKPVTWKSATSHASNCGILGLGISLLWYSEFKDNAQFLVGLCVLAGLGGMATVELFVELGRKLASSFLPPNKREEK
jgi:hypothetical protein